MKLNSSTKVEVTPSSGNIANALLSAAIPVRVQRKRTKGYRMPENTVYVGRPTKWGNQYIVGKTIRECDYYANPDYDEKDFYSPKGVNFRQPYVDSLMRRKGYTNETIITNEIAVELYAAMMDNYLIADDTGYYVMGEYVEPEGLGRLQKDLEKLKGKNLACFCPLDKPCHVDYLLELVNG